MEAWAEKAPLREMKITKAIVAVVWDVHLFLLVCPCGASANYSFRALRIYEFCQVYCLGVNVCFWFVSVALEDLLMGRGVIIIKVFIAELP
jgi:hypothetical protein